MVSPLGFPPERKSSHSHPFPFHLRLLDFPVQNGRSTGSIPASILQYFSRFFFLLLLYLNAPEGLAQIVVYLTNYSRRPQTRTLFAHSFISTNIPVSALQPSRATGFSDVRKWKIET